MMKDFVIPLLVSILAGLIIWIMQAFITLSWWIVIGIILAAVSITYFIYLIYVFIKIRALGIIQILSKSDKGAGSTKSYMIQANREICFVGIAASKWINQRDTFEKTIRRICGLKGGHIRFLLLNPDSESAKKLSLSDGEIGNELIVKRTILSSLKSLDELIDKLKQENGDIDLASNIEIRLYNQMPVFRLAIIDNSLAYFCFYRLCSDGNKLKQLVIKPSKHEGGLLKDTNNIFNSLCDYFENLWSSKDTVEYSTWKSEQKKEQE